MGREKKKESYDVCVRHCCEHKSGTGCLFIYMLLNCRGGLHKMYGSNIRHHFVVCTGTGFGETSRSLCNCQAYAMFFLTDDNYFEWLI